MSKEIILSNITELNSAIIDIEANFKKEEQDQEGIIIRFADTISQSDLEECLCKLWKFEEDSQHTIDILIKNLSYDLRRYALGLALKNNELRNPIFLMNVFCLVKGYNTFEEAYFEHEEVFLNDEVELLDIFDDLEDEIYQVTKQTAIYYLSMLKTCNLMEAVDANPKAVNLPYLYAYLFSLLDVTVLAKILSSVKDSSIWNEQIIVLNSLSYLSQIAEKFVFTNTVMEMLGKELLENSIKETVNSIKESKDI